MTQQNQRKMLEFCKSVLIKVSFDRLLFKKELKKAIGWVKKEELIQLKEWCMFKFGHKYEDIILSSFQTSFA